MRDDASGLAGVRDVLAGHNAFAGHPVERKRHRSRLEYLACVALYCFERKIPLGLPVE
jgi:hypothetical protein